MKTMASNMCGVSSKIDSKRLARQKCNSYVTLGMRKRTATPNNSRGQSGSLEVILTDAPSQWYGSLQVINNEKVADCAPALRSRSSRHTKLDQVDTTTPPRNPSRIQEHPAGPCLPAPSTSKPDPGMQLSQIPQHLA